MSASASASAPSICFVCNKGGTDVVLQKCARCKARTYCGRACQTADWPMHKATCKAPLWYDKYRECEDGSKHEGRLELITWACPGEGTGWGHVPIDQEDDLRRKFEVEYGGDELKLYKYWPYGFRWTCCGTHARMKYGCDHHGTGSHPCTCDFCRMGKPLPAKIWNEQTAQRMGLQLSRGPDPRSFHPGLATLAATSRTMMGLNM